MADLLDKTESTAWDDDDVMYIVRDPAGTPVDRQIKMKNVLAYKTINMVIDGGGATLTTGVKLDVQVDFSCEIMAATLLANQSGSIVVNIWKDTYANFPPTVADKITASAPPTISGATKSTDSTLTGWTKTVAAGDVLRVNVDSVTSIQRVTLSLKVKMTGHTA